MAQLIKIFTALFLVHFANGQEVSIEIGKSFLSDEGCFIVVTDEYGEVIHHSTEFEGQNEEYLFVDFYNRNATTRIDVSVFTLNNYGGEEHYYCSTFLNVQNGDLLTQHWWKSVKYKRTKNAMLTINGVHEVHEISFGSSTYYETNLDENEGLKLSFDHLWGTDLYFALRCNNEKDFRYTYIPYREINTSMNLDWSDFSSGIDTIEVALPNEEEWLANIHARNTSTGSECFFHSGLVEPNTNKIRLLLPRDQQFNRYTTIFNANVENDSYKLGLTYDIVNERLTLIDSLPIINYEDFLLINESDGLSIVDISEQLDFEIRYTFNHPRVIRDPILTWTVHGKTNEFMQFDFPKIPQQVSETLYRFTNIYVRNPYMIDVKQEFSDRGTIIMTDDID